MLLVGIPAIDHTSRWLLIKILANFNLSLPDLICSPQICSPDYVPTLFSIWLPLLLGYLYYFHVRQLGRTILSLLWALAFVTTAVGIIMSLPYDVIGIEWSLRAPWSWLNEIYALFFLFVLIWFARQASRVSFSHALVLIGLSIFLFNFGLVMNNLVFPLLEDRTVSWEFVALNLAGILFALWVLLRLGVPSERHEADVERWIDSWDIPFYGAALRRLAVRILPRFDPARDISKELLAALFGLFLLPQAYGALRFWDLYRFETAETTATTVAGIAYAPLWIVLVILLAYAVRVRQPTEGPENDPKAGPTKPFLSPRYGSQEKPPIS